MKKLLAAAVAATLFAGQVMAQDLAPLNSDTEANRMDWAELEAKFGAFPKMPEGLKVGGVSKTLTNEYWRTLGEGYQRFAEKAGVEVAYQAAQSEGDQLGQLTIAEGMVTQGYKVLLVSPQTDANLQPVMEQAKSAGIPVVNVNDAVIPQAEHYVGNVQRDNGVRVAKWFIEKYPEGGKVAIVEGQAGVYAAVQRTDGFRKTIEESGKFQVVASVPGNWDRQTSYDAATNILQQHPDLVGFYANNDGMALGIVEAVKSANLLGKVAVFGTDGTSDAYKSIEAGELTGTVDSFSILTGEVAMEVALRLSAGQALPRVVATPQALITADNFKEFQGSPDDVRALLMKAAGK
ncbi:sugar ABC transporter substrate-binding protein [Rhizobium sp.]